MGNVGMLLIVLSFIIGIVGVGGGVIGLLNSYRASPSTSVVAIVVGAMSWVLLYALGEALIAFEGMAKDAQRGADAAERSAEALEYLAQRQRRTQMSAKSPATDRQSATVLRSIDKS